MRKNFLLTGFLSLFISVFFHPLSAQNNAPSVDPVKFLIDNKISTLDKIRLVSPNLFQVCAGQVNTSSTENLQCYSKWRADFPSEFDLFSREIISSKEFQILLGYIAPSAKSNSNGSSLPGFIDTGDPVKDAENHAAQKAGWINSNPEAYDQMLNESKQNSVSTGVQTQKQKEETLRNKPY